MRDKFIKALIWLVLTVLASVEFLVLYHGDLPPGVGYSIVPLKQSIASYDSLFVDGAIESNYNLLLLPFMYIGPSVRDIVYILFTFIIAFLSVSYSVDYFFTRYISRELSRMEIFLVQVSASISLTLSFYFGGGQFFVYSFFIALLPFGLTVFDRILSSGEQKNWREIITGSIVTGATASLLVVDTRTLVYTVLILLGFELYSVTIRPSFRNVLRVIEILSATALFYALINIRFFIAIFLLRNDGVTAIGDIVPVQLFISYMRYNFYYAITGSANWSGAYNSKYVLLGLISFITALIPLFMKKVKPIILFFVLIIFTLVAYATIIAPIFNYYIGQTSFYPYLVYSDIDYVFNVLYDPFLYLMFGLGLLALMLYARKLKKRGKLVGTILVVVILATQFAYLYPEATGIHSSNRTVQVPGYIRDASEYLYSLNISGNVLVIANFSVETNQYLTLPNAITSDTGWNGWLLSYPDYLMSVNFPAFARAMTYLGVQYIVYNALNYSSYTTYLANQPGLKDVLNTGPVHIYENTYFVPKLETTSGFYIAFNVPMAIEYLSLLNVTVPIVPSYYVNNFSQIERYSSGIILPNNNSKILPSIYADSNNSYTINLGSMTINQAPYGWQIAPVIFLGDQQNAIFESSSLSPVPLNVNIDVPKGEYYVYVEGGVSVTSQYGSSKEGFNISSGNQSVTAMFNQTAFAPMISESYAGILNVTTNALKIFPTSEGGPYEPFISKITLIPVKNMDNIMNSVNNFSSSHLIAGYPENLSSPINSSSSLSVIQYLSGKTNHRNINGSIIMDFTHENMGLWSFEQPVIVSGSIFSASYYYGLYNLYVSTNIHPLLKYFDSSGVTLIYLNIIVDTVIAVVFISLGRRRKT
jgi:hypothetical protein